MVELVDGYLRGEEPAGGGVWYNTVVLYYEIRDDWDLFARGHYGVLQ